jgi:hypothetical protein
MSEQIRMKYSLPGCAATKVKAVKVGQTISDIISMTAKLAGVDIDELSLDGMVLAEDECLDDYYDSLDQLFVFSKSLTKVPRQTSFTASDDQHVMKM